MDWLKLNVGVTDRMVRAVLGIILLAAFAFNVVGEPWSWVVGVLGVVLLLTAAMGRCILYSLLGMKTN